MTVYAIEPDRVLVGFRWTERGLEPIWAPRYPRAGVGG
jgi:hypothetical protein